MENVPGHHDVFVKFHAVGNQEVFIKKVSLLR